MLDFGYSGRSASIEYNVHNVDITQLPSPRVIISHLPYYLVPKTLRAKKGKVIYVYRNPKDILVSYFHYVNAWSGMENSRNLEEYMQRFLSGNGTVLKICKFIGKELSSQEVDKVVEMSTFKNMKADPRANVVKTYEECFGLKNITHLRKGTVGDWKNIMTVSQSESSLWLDHVEGWYAHKGDFNILFLSYEEMKKDLRSSVPKICNFLGRELTEKEVDDVVDKATFDNMKMDPRTNYKLMNPTIADSSKGGIVWYWKNIMTVAQNQIMEIVDKFLCKYKGFYFVRNQTSAENIDSIENFEIQDDDTFLITYPKSGHRDGTENITLIDRIPWLEYNVFQVDLTSRPSPRVICSHLPYYLVPKGLRNKRAKIIYVFRNPKDVLASMYHFHKISVTLETPKDFDTFLEKFLAGKVGNSLWLDHIEGWCTHKDDFNILFLSYEEMKKDLRSSVLKICNFLGKELSEKEVDDVVDKATFDNMKMDARANYRFMPSDQIDFSKGDFLRKGTIGDWKNLMTVAQSERFDRIIYVFRNPKDVLVSLYHFHKISVILETPKDFDTFLEKFLAGKVGHSLWLDHIEGWCTHKDDFNILFLSYEEMKRDLRSSVLKICNFLGKELSEKEVDDVVDKATFDNMKMDSRANYTFMPSDQIDFSKGDFLRKGKSNERFDSVFKERMEKLPFKFCWDIQEDPQPISSSAEENNITEDSNIKFCAIVNYNKTYRKLVIPDIGLQITCLYYYYFYVVQNARKIISIFSSSEDKILHGDFNFELHVT
ncbi:Amine sulfotransferase, partial [Ophiophagus hannah]